MTRQNWARMIDRNISGNPTNTCIVAALDCLMDNRSIPARVYAEIESAYLQQQLTGLSQDELDATIALLSRYVNAERFKKHLLVATEYQHVVGLKPRNNYLWEMVGIWVPTRRLLYPQEVWSFVFRPHKNFPTDYRINALLIDR